MGSVEVQGLSELRKTLLSLSAEIASKNGGPVRSALAKGAKRVRDQARISAPIGEGKKYGSSLTDGGRLRRAIVSSRDKNPASEGLTESYVVRVRRGKDRADTTGAYYWSFVEFGTVRQSPQPFMRQTFENTKQSFADEFTEDLTKAIANAVKKAAKNG